MRKDTLDKFYTKPDLAKKLIDSINTNYKLIIEPSAGNGSFSNLLNCLAFDIEPQHPSITKQDFLTWNYTGNIESKDILCIGNPPFGKQGNLAMKFLTKCMTIADTVAFILPPSFVKQSVMNKIPLNFRVSYCVALEEEFLFDGKEYKVPSIFQVWIKDGMREIVKAEKPVGYEYVDKKDANLAIRRVGFYAGKPSLDIDKNEQTHYFIKTDKVELFMEKLSKYEWNHNNTVGPRSISKYELNKVLNKIYENYN